MSHTASDLGLQGYKNWRNSLQPYPNGTVIKFTQPYVGVTKGHNISAGQEFMIVDIQPSLGKEPVYKMVVYSNGKIHKKTMYFNLEFIARRVIDKECEIVK